MVSCFACAVSWATWLLFTAVPARCVALCVRCSGPLGSCSPVRSPGVLCGVLGHFAPVYRCARSMLFAVGCVCGASLRGAHSSIRTAAIRSRQGLGTIQAGTRPSGRRLFVAGRGWVPSGRTRIHPDGGCSVAGRGWVRCRARTRPSGRRLVLLGTRPRAVVCCVLCALSGFAAPGGRCCLAPVRVPWFWPAACLSGVPHGPARCAAPPPVRSLSVLRLAFPTPWCLFPPRGLAPPALLGGCAGHAEAGREPGSLCLPLAPAEAGALGSLRVVPVRGLAMGLSLAGPSGVGLGLRAMRCLACVDPVTDASGFLYHQSFGGELGRCTGAVSCGRRHLPSRVGGLHASVPCVCACAHPSWPGRAVRPPGRVLVRPTFSFGRFVFLLCLAPFGLGLPLSWSFVCPPPSLVLFFFFLRCCFPRAPLVSCFLWLPAPVAPDLGAVCFFSCWLSVRSRLVCVSAGCYLVVAAPPPPLFASRSFCCRRSVPCVFFSLLLLSAPPLSLEFSGFWPRVPWALALCFVGLPLPGSPCALASFVCLARPLAAPWWLLPPPPPLLCLAVLVVAARCSVLFFFLRCAPPLSLAFFGFRPRVPWASALCVVCFVALPLHGSPCALASFVLPAWLLAAPWWLLPPPPPFCVSRFSSLPLGACAVCCAVLCVPQCGAAPCCCALCSPVFCCCVVCCFVALVWCRCLLCRALRRCPSPWGPVLCGAVFCDVPPRCVLCAVCVLSWRGGARCCWPLCFVLCVSWGAVLCVPCPLHSVRCCALLCWCACVMLFVWCVLLLAPGAVMRCCVLCCFLPCAVVRCWVWWPVAVCWWRVSVSVSLFCRVVRFPCG